ncbi:MAG: alanine/glycine:cation symporter family protein [Cellulosilyticaceae bacterium]
MNLLQNFVSTTNTLLWSYILIGLLIILGLFFTFKTHFVQFVLLKDMIKLLGEGTNRNKEDPKSVSSFQAFCISTASRVGTGNLAGVAIAISTGGPGAVFWMWLIALIGAASSFIESTLAQVYKVRAKESYIGGPAYYMEKGLKKRWMGITFSILITLCFGLVFNAVQSNTISLAFEQAFVINRMWTGITLVVVSGLIIFGGIQRIAKFAEVIVPIMALAYIFVALIVIFKNITLVPEIFLLIFKNAFGIEQVVGGGIGSAIMLGIKRGLFSNEAGMGSAPNAAATAETSHPAKQGLIQTLGVFTDTILICSCTAFIILLSGTYTLTGLNGIQLTQTALSSQVGSWGSTFIAFAILLFAFSSIVGNYYYGESNIRFMSSNKLLLFIYRLAVLGMILFGAFDQNNLVWDMADLFMGLMAIINLIAIFALRKVAFKVLEDYKKQRKQGKNPTFSSTELGIKDAECWEK